MPKMFFRDSGLLHQLLGIKSPGDLLAHPKAGASWEGFVIEETLKKHRTNEAYFWATHNGAELDLLLFDGKKRIGVECKRSDSPRWTPSMRIAVEDLRLDRLVVVHPGERKYALGPRTEAIPASQWLFK